jgi:hypothetical protein
MKNLIDISTFFEPSHMKPSYGSYVSMIHDRRVTAEELYAEFRSRIIDAIGCRYLPVYRMADGEFIFMFGYRWNWRSKRPFRALASYFKYSYFWYFGHGFKTSWGECYSRTEINKIRREYDRKIGTILEDGFICPFLYLNEIRQYESHNRQVLKYFRNRCGGRLDNSIYPFHFPFFLFSLTGWQDILQGVSILVVTGGGEARFSRIKSSLISLGAANVSVLEVSSSRSMFDVLDSSVKDKYLTCEIALVAAGIGALNIIEQMSWFNGPVIDVGGFVQCLVDNNFIYHGGAVRMPIQHKDADE